MELVDTLAHNALYPFMLLGNRLCIDFAIVSFSQTNGKWTSLQD